MVLAPVLVRPIDPRSPFRQFWDTAILACVLCVQPPRAVEEGAKGSKR